SGATAPNRNHSMACHASKRASYVSTASMRLALLVSRTYAGAGAPPRRGQVSRSRDKNCKVWLPPSNCLFAVCKLFLEELPPQSVRAKNRGGNEFPPPAARRPGFDAGPRGQESVVRSQ